MVRDQEIAATASEQELVGSNLIPRDVRESTRVRRLGNSVLEMLRTHRVLLIGIAVSLVALVAIRGDWLLSANSLNPDEAQLLASGRQARIDFIPYHTYTTYTYLFVWPIFLGFLNLLGVPMSFVTAHVLNAAFALFLVVFGWYLISRYYGWKLASFLVLPTAIFYFADAGQQGTSLDLYSLTTESLPIALTVIGLAVAVTPHSALSVRRVILCAVICGIAPWAKPQIGPLALSIVYSCVLIRRIEAIEQEGSTWGSRNSFSVDLAKDLAMSTAAFAVPSLVAIMFLLLFGELGNFVHLGLSGTSGVFSYLSVRNATLNSPLARITALAQIMEQFHVVFYWAIAGIVGWRLVAGSKRLRLNVLRVIAWALPLIAAIATLAVLGQFFLHYSNVLFAGAIASGVIGARLSQISIPGTKTSAWRTRLTTAIAIGACVSVFLDTGGVDRVRSSWNFAADEVKSLVTNGRLVANQTFDMNGSSLSRTCPPTAEVFVFGWANELYAYYDWTPADEFLVENWGVPTSSASIDAARLIVLHLKRVPPRCIVQATGSAFFGDIPTTDTIARVLPGIGSLLNDCYRRQVTTVGIAALGWTGEAGQSVTYWVRKNNCS